MWNKKAVIQISRKKLHRNVERKSGRLKKCCIETLFHKALWVSKSVGIGIFIKSWFLQLYKEMKEFDSNIFGLASLKGVPSSSLEIPLTTRNNNGLYVCSLQVTALGYLGCVQVSFISRCVSSSRICPSVYLNSCWNGCTARLHKHITYLKRNHHSFYAACVYHTYIWATSALGPRLSCTWHACTDLWCAPMSCTCGVLHSIHREFSLLGNGEYGLRQKLSEDSLHGNQLVTSESTKQ